MRQTDSHPASTPDRTFVSAKELARRWNCSVTSARRIARRADIPCCCLGEGRNGMIRYRLADIERYEASRMSDPNAD